MNIVVCEEPNSKRNPAQWVREYTKAGLACVPIRKKSKDTKGLWKWSRGGVPEYEWANFWRHEDGPCGIAILCGERSGNLEVLDFDNRSTAPESMDYRFWRFNLPPMADKVAWTLPIIATPSGGRHVVWRCEVIEGNQKFARNSAGESLIETRGEGGLFVAPGSPDDTHKSGRSYRLTQGSLLDVPTITPEVRAVFLEHARQRDKYRQPVAIRTARATNDREQFPTGYRPGDDYEQAVTWAEVLEPFGWVETRDGWTRPGKDTSDGISASVHGDKNNLHVFTSSAPPFEQGGNYSKFAAFALLRCGGDFGLAAARLASRGYGCVIDRSEEIEKVIGGLS
jgi:hypothetical protein